jgi:hypothetical protein
MFQARILVLVPFQTLRTMEPRLCAVSGIRAVKSRQGVRIAPICCGEHEVCNQTVPTLCHMNQSRDATHLSKLRWAFLDQVVLHFLVWLNSKVRVHESSQLFFLQITRR